MTATPALVNDPDAPGGLALHDPQHGHALHLRMDVDIDAEGMRGHHVPEEGTIVGFTWGINGDGAGWMALVQPPDIEVRANHVPIGHVHPAARRPPPPVAAELIRSTGRHFDLFDEVVPVLAPSGRSCMKVDLYEAGHQHPMSIELGQLGVPVRRNTYGPTTFIAEDYGHVFQVVQIEPPTTKGEVVLLVRDLTEDSGLRPNDPVRTLLVDPRDLVWDRIGPQ